MIDFAFLDEVLRTPGLAAARSRDGAAPGAVARTSLVTVGVAAIAFGAAVGSWRGGRQIAYAAIKMPVVLLGTLVLVAPAFYVLAATLGRPWRVRPTATLMLAAGTRFALALLALTPPLWLAIDLGTPYDVVKLLATVAYGLAGFAGLEVLVRGLGDGRGMRLTLALFGIVFLLVGGQNAWILRPYLGVPTVAKVTFFTNAREGGLLGQLRESATDLGGRRHRAAAR